MRIVYCMYINSNICFFKNNVHVILRRASGFYFRFINIIYECMYCLKEHDCCMVYTHKPSYHSIYDKISSKQMGKKKLFTEKIDNNVHQKTKAHIQNATGYCLSCI
jgi:hypothetical protein